MDAARVPETEMNFLVHEDPDDVDAVTNSIDLDAREDLGNFDNMMVCPVLVNGFRFFSSPYYC